MRTTLVCLLLATSLVACKKKEADPGQAASGSGSASPTAAAKPFTGPLTKDLVMNSAHEIDVYTPDGKPSPFASSLAAAKLKLGEPTHVEGTKYMWGVVDGDTCTYYLLEDKGGTASSPGSKSVDHKAEDPECLMAAGQAAAAGSAGSAGSAAGSASGSGSAAGSATP
jgi:hypothetical protein